MFNEKLLEEGYAQVRTFPPNTKYQTKFQEAEREAQQAERGIWSLDRIEVIQLMDKADTPGGDGCSQKATPKAPRREQPAPSPAPTPDVPSNPVPSASGADMDCNDFATQAEAQQYLLPGDPHGLDRDGNGIACESL